jgi:ketosteroid isomerase-like protein
MKTLALATLNLLVLVLSSCRSTCCSPFEEPDHGKLETAARAFEAACNSADWDAVGALYAEAAVLMPPNMPAVHGRQAIRDFFAGFPPVTDMRLECEEIRGCGDLAYVTGTYSMTIRPPGGAVIEDTGHFLEIHRRAADGSWPIVRDIYHSSLPTP